MTKVTVDLGPVQETLLIPLLGRAVETRKDNGLIHDEKAVHIVESLDYDFSKWEKSKSLSGATIRTRMFDDDVQSFLADYPTGTVVEIGCGLNTRFERLDNGQAQWFDLDLPDSLALRRQFFQDQPRRTMLEASVLETDWMEPVAATGGPWCRSEEHTSELQSPCNLVCRLLLEKKKQQKTKKKQKKKKNKQQDTKNKEKTHKIKLLAYLLTCGMLQNLVEF